jgi:hypothetical protein
LVNDISAGYWWLTSVILAIWEAEIKRIKAEGQFRQTVLKTCFANVKLRIQTPVTSKKTGLDSGSNGRVTA